MPPTGPEADDTDAVVALLVRRGVDVPAAEALARTHGAEAVQRAVALYDERRRSPKPPSGPGWLVAALREGWAARRPAAEAPLLTHPEMLRWCEAHGGLHRTAEFEAVPQAGGGVAFRRRSEDQPEDQRRR